MSKPTGDPIDIDNLLDQAASYAKQHLEDDTFVDFNFHHTKCTGKGNEVIRESWENKEMIKVQECNDKGDGAGGGQRGVYAKCDIKAGTNLVIANPIVVYWDAEADDSDDDDNEEEEQDVMLENAMLGSSDSDGDDDDESVGDHAYYVDEDGKKVIDMDAELEKFDNELVERHDENKKRKASSKRGKSNNGDDSSDCDDDENGSDDDDSSAQGPTGTKRNGILVLRIIEKIKQSPSLWTDTISKLFPRNVDQALSLPPWFCGDASIGMEIENQMQNNLPFGDDDDDEEMRKEIALRLPLIVRYNVLSMETCSELFVYPDGGKGGMVCLAGTGLYGPEVSYFNHSCRPNVSRYCIGDVMFFVTNRDVGKGEELCFSYIEHELLCENAKRRSDLLDMDFELEDDDDGKNGSKHSNANGDRPKKKQKVAYAKMPPKEEEEDEDEMLHHYPLIDAEMQSELMATPPVERLDLVNELLEQKADTALDFQCDKYQLHILKAITLDGLRKSHEALLEWETAIDFAVKNFPPLDETTIALRVQAALCALIGVGVGNGSSKDKKAKKASKQHAKAALKMHILLFGGGKERFFKRYEKELACPLRSIPQQSMKMDVQRLFY